MLGFSILILLPLLTALLCYFVKNMRVQYNISLLVGVLHLFVTLMEFLGAYHIQLPTFFSFDSLSKLFLLILSNVYFWVVLVSYSYLKRPVTEKAKAGQRYYFLLLNFYLASNSAAMLSSHFGMYWVTAETTTLAVAPLIYYYRNEEALEAMWKYLFLVSVGIAFAFIGILFLTLSANGSVLEGQQLFFWEFIRNAKGLNPIWLKASFIFIFVGLSTKIGIAPMHSGDVDATSNAPSPIAALMSGSLRLTALLGVMRIFQIITPTSSFEFARTIMIVGGLLSLFTAFVFMFKVNNYKRMLAYSSVEHLGLIALGVATGGIAFVGAMYHAIYNSITKVVLFLSAGNIHSRFKSREVDRVRNVLNILPKTGWLFLLAYLAISGIPPFGIFFSEIKIFEGILFSDKPFVLLLVMVFMLFIFINMGKIVFTMLYKKGNEEVAQTNPEKFDIIHFAAILLLILLVTIAITSPEIIYHNILNVAKDFGVTL
ncbi:MAG TPA: proton-conducting transporter membrane subunit [Ignavibacteriaceae bacterium]|nr:proton-conducting transporter membrane subunit [Ignavibacteriaceae bacterium]